MTLETLDHRAPSLFKQQASRTSQLALYSALALFLMVADARFKITAPVRTAVSAALAPVQWLVAQPVQAYQNASRYAEVQQQAVAREDEARKQLVVMAQRAEQADRGFGAVLQEQHAAVAVGEAAGMQRAREAFGGVGQSGLGREGGFEAMRFFTESKNVGIALR